jgi:hypothetical protein
VSEPIDDKAFDEYLERQSQVSRQYRGLEGRDVPPDLDRRVLAQAAQAVQKKQPSKMRSWKAWSVPVALAASTVLTLAVVIESGLEHKLVMPTEVSMESHMPPASSEAGSAEALAFEPQSPADTSATSLPQAANSNNDEPKREQRQSADRVEAEPSAPAELRTAPGEKSGERLTAAARREAPAPISPAPQSNAEPARTEGLVAPPATAISQVASQRPFVPAPQPQSEPAREEVAKAAGEAASSGDLAEITVSGNRRQDRTILGPRNTLMRRGPPAEADADQATLEEQRREEDPARWLEFIRELRRDRKAEEADRQWSEFRKVYPEYEVAEADSARPQR